MVNNGKLLCGKINRVAEHEVIGKQSRTEDSVMRHRINNLLLNKDVVMWTF